MSIILDGTTGITTPGLTNTGTETLVNLTTTGNTILGDASTDTLNVGNGGLIKDANGNVGIGVTPSAWSLGKALEIGTVGNAVWSTGAADVRLTSNVYYASSNYKYATTNTASILLMPNDGTLQFSNAASGTAGTNISFTNRLTLDASGNLGVGITSPGARLDVSASSGTLFRALNNGVSQILMGNGGTSTNYYDGDTQIFRSGNATERARIDSSGNLLVGATTNAPSTTNGAYIYGASGGSGYFLNNNTTTAGISLALFYSSYSTANQTKFEVTSEGNVKSRTNSYAGFSDERLKQNITPSASQWDAIKDIEVIKFQFKSEQFSDEENPWMLGVVAQQVEQTSPGLVDIDPKDGMKTVKYSILYMKAVKALQENMSRTEMLERLVQEQQSIINTLTDRISALEQK